MATCAKCGSLLSEGAAFCTVCGSPVAGVQNPVPGTTAGMTSNVAAALSYLLGIITGVLFLAMEPYKRDPFVRFHAFQSICFSVVAILLGMIWNRILWAGFYTFGFLVSLLGLVGSLIGLAMIGYWLFLMYKAYNKEQYRIPIIGEFALRQASK
jgi:uncharacterized membrane protein